jgi:adenine-specific DNA methylase
MQGVGLSTVYHSFIITLVCIYIKDKMKSIMEKDYEFTNFLVERGWGRELARKVCKEIGIEKIQLLIYLSRVEIDQLVDLSFKQKEELWNLVCNAWRELTLERRNKELEILHGEQKIMIEEMLESSDRLEKTKRAHLQSLLLKLRNACEDLAEICRE